MPTEADTEVAPPVTVTVTDHVASAAEADDVFDGSGVTITPAPEEVENLLSERLARGPLPSRRGRQHSSLDAFCSVSSATSSNRDSKVVDCGPLEQHEVADEPPQPADVPPGPTTVKLVQEVEQEEKTSFSGSNTLNNFHRWRVSLPKLTFESSSKQPGPASDGTIDEEGESINEEGECAHEDAGQPGSSGTFVTIAGVSSSSCDETFQAKGLDTDKTTSSPAFVPSFMAMMGDASSKALPVSG